MASLKDLIDEKLWDSIKRNYLAESYTNAILDSIQFIGDLIREKSGVAGDGNTLIGTAFGGTNPKIKVNNLRTESEKNVQKGIESLLRGVYSAFRNPRSHSKYEDDETAAFEIIILINHLLKLVDQSKGRFTIDLFLKRVIDSDFVQTHKYADLLVSDIPVGKRLEVAIEVFQKKEECYIHNLKYIWTSLYKTLNENENREILEMVSEELRFTDSYPSIIRCIAIFEKAWDQIDEDARLRAENKMIKLIPQATLNRDGGTNAAGTYASWFTSIINKSSLREKISYAIYESLSSHEEDKQRFIVHHYGEYIESFEDRSVHQSLLVIEVI